MAKLYENSMEAIFFFDQHGKVLAMNPAAEEIVADDVLEQLYSGQANAICGVCRGYMSETELRTCLTCYFNAPDVDDFSSFQVYLDTKGKGIVSYAASYHVIDSDQQLYAFMLKDLTTQFKTQEKFYQNTMMKHVIEAQENERKRISRELHDSVAQELMSALIDLRVFKYMTQDTTLLQKMKHTEASMTRLLDDIRNLAVELRPAALDDFGLEAAFRSHFKRLQESYGFTVEFESTLCQKRYSSEIETVIYRICQEAVLNALKYAQTDKIKVSIYEQNKLLQLIIEDEGIGFEMGSDPIGTGLGLYGIRERAELVGGIVNIYASPGKGTKIHLQISILD